MDRSWLMEQLKDKKELEAAVCLAAENTDTIPLLLDIAETERTAVKYQAEKVLRKISEENEALLLPHADRIIGLLKRENSFIKWGTLLTLSNLLAAGGKSLWERMRPSFLPSFQSNQIAEFGNAVSCLAKIVRVCPEEERTVIPILLAIDGHTFLRHGEVSPECLNVAKGHIIDCFAALYPESGYQEEMAAFAQQCLSNDRKQVREKARRFLKQLG